MQPAYASTGRPIAGAVATQGENIRLQFIKKTYAHLAGAIFAFMGVTALLLNSEFGAKFATWALTGGQWNWLIVLGLFMGAGYLANRLAWSDSSVQKQYLGLAIYIVAEALIMTPLLYIAMMYSDPSIIPNAAILTLILFGGLTAIPFITKKDFTFLSKTITIVSLCALGLIVGGIAFGFTLGLWFAVAMVALAGLAVLRDTSLVMQHFPPSRHVAASLSLFASIAMMFYYIVYLLMSLSRD